MTVSTENDSNRYVATSLQTVFPYTFKVQAAADLVVVQQGTTLVLTTQYTVSGVGVAGGGNVTLVTGATLNDKVTIVRGMTKTQETDYVTNDAFPANSHEDALDKLTMIAQEQDEKLDRALIFSVESTQSNVTFPDPGTTGQHITWTAAGALQNTTLAVTGTATSVDETDTNATKDKLVSNNLMKDATDTAQAVKGVQAASAVNQFQATNSATTDPLLLQATGTDAAIGITITPKGTGDLILDGVKWPQADGSVDQVLKTNGSGQLSYASQSTLLYQPGFINSLILSNDTDTANDINITAGACVDSTNAVNILLASEITKQIDANWAVGDDAGGFPSALTLTNDTWYHVFVIIDTATGTVDAGFDTSLTATNLLTDASAYDNYRRIGSVRRATGTNELFTQIQNVVYWTTPPSTVNPGTGTVTLLTPPGVNCMAELLAVITGSTAPGGAVSTFRPVSGSHSISNLGGETWYANPTTSNFNDVVNVMTDTSSGIHNIDAATALTMYVLSYVDYRGIN